MREYILKIAGKEYRSEIKEITSEHARIVVNDQEFVVELLELGRKKISAPEFSRPPLAEAAATPRPATVSATTPAQGARPAGGEGVHAPLPGLILDVFIKEGDKVQAGQDLVLMEAMKMENHIQAPHNGTVKKLFVKKDDNVMEGDVLVEISRPAMTTL
ncbi:MAG: biotin/lipoyl-binding protein [Acidobacteria bacterium]|nr:biotin/lipoyl-binding protein [Acidobacteriota bacterium]